jgi:hypothetical protein
VTVGAEHTTWKTRVTENKWWVGGGAVAVAALLVAGTMMFIGNRGEASACEPGYVPCLPVVRDLNCQALDFAVQVTGVDVYGLDRDGDGIGCETSN